MTNHYSWTVNTSLQTGRSIWIFKNRGLQAKIRPILAKLPLLMLIMLLSVAKTPAQHKLPATASAFLPLATLASSMPGYLYPASSIVPIQDQGNNGAFNNKLLNMNALTMPPCSFVATNVTVSNDGGCFAAGVYTPSTLVNGVQSWVNGTGDTKRIQWSGTQWQITYFGSLILATNTTGNATFLPCNGWQIGIDDGECSGAITLSGGCGSLVAPTVSPQVSINANPGNSINSGTSVTFTASPTNGGGTPAYQWQKNGNNVGSNSATYTDGALDNGDIITCIMTSSDPCASPASATSNTITMDVAVVCYPDITVTDFVFDFAGVYTYIDMYNGAPRWASESGNFIYWDSYSYVWFIEVPDNPFFGGGYSLYNDSGSASQLPCTGWSGPTFSGGCGALPVAGVEITASPGNNILAGENVTFTATPVYGGSAPVYQWKKNGNNVGTNSSTYADAALINGDIIQVEMTSNHPCVPQPLVSSNTIAMTVTDCSNATAFDDPFYEHVTGITSYGSFYGAGIAYGDGKFVACLNHYDEGAYLFTSSDGANWIEQNPPSPAGYGFSNVVYANNQFLMTGCNGYVFTSTDGLNWTAHSTGVNECFPGIAFGNDTWLIAGDNAVLLKSTDNGLTWTGIATPAGVNWVSATYGNGVFVITGLGNTMFASSDLVNWTPWDLYAFSYTSLHVAFGDGQFVAAHSSGNIYTSTNGINWTIQDSGNTNPLFQIVHLNGQFLASNTFEGTGGKIINSGNGICWESMSTGFPYGFTNMAYGNGIYAAVSGNGILYSTVCHPPVALALETQSNCAEGNGGIISLSQTEINYAYQLHKNGAPVGAPLAGNGDNLFFTGILEPGTYAVSATSSTGACTNDMDGSVLMISGETPVVGSTPPFCIGDAVNLSATSSVGSINWYDAETGGNLLGNSASGENFSFEATQAATFYAQISGVSFGSATFEYTGNAQTFTVPEGVTSIHVIAKGAGGSDGYYDNSQPGEGGTVETDLTVTPGQVLNIFVGGVPTGEYGEIGGYNGGGNSLGQYYGAGGGASDIRIGGIGLAQRVIVAGAGGGSAYDNTNGGNGGGLIGENGDDDTTYPNYAKGGGGGTQSAGGAGGYGYDGAGFSGALGIGGDGSDYSYYGGGGGGGYFGGGGGGESDGYAGAGGGGSSYALPSLCSNILHTQGGNAGNGIVLLSWGDGCISPLRVPVVLQQKPTPTSISLANVSVPECSSTTCSTDDTFTADVVVNYDSKPAEGTLALTGATIVGTLTPVNIDDIGANSYTFTNVTFVADGNTIDLTAAFSEGCSHTQDNASTAPSCSGTLCGISGISLSETGSCNDNGTISESDDFFTTDVTITFAYAPASATLTLKRGNLILASTQTDLTCTTFYTFENIQLPSNGENVVLTAEFSINCTFTSDVLMTAPQPCSCQPTTSFDTCPANMPINTAAGACGAVATYTALANGDPSPAYTYVFSGATIGNGTGTGSGSTFATGLTNVTVTATNACGMAVCSFAVTVTDNQNPTIGCPAAQMLALGTNCSVALPDYRSLATTADNCGVQSLVQSPAAGMSVSGVGSMNITLTVTDLNNRTNNCQFAVSKTDNSVPIIACTNSTISFSGAATMTLNPANLATATDNCGTPSITLSTPTVTCAQIGQTITVTVTAADASNNTATCNSQVTVTGLPCGWIQDADGINCPGGNDVDYANTVFTVNSTNCYTIPPYAADESGYAYHELCGNGSIMAQVLSVSNNGWAGVAMRESDNQGARKVQLLTNLSSLSRREVRYTFAGDAYPQQFPSQSKYWLRILRYGSQFVGYASANGVSWSQVFALTVAGMPECLQAGLVVTNSQANSFVYANFAQVNVVANPSPLAAFEGEGLDDAFIEHEFKVFPNPTSGEVLIDLTPWEGKPTVVDVYDLQGRQVYRQELQETFTPAHIDLGHLPNGVYILRIEDVVQRVILQR